MQPIQLIALDPWPPTIVFNFKYTVVVTPFQFESIHQILIVYLFIHSFLYEYYVIKQYTLQEISSSILKSESTHYNCSLSNCQNTVDAQFCKSISKSHEKESPMKSKAQRPTRKTEE